MGAEKKGKKRAQERRGASGAVSPVVSVTEAGGEPSPQFWGRGQGEGSCGVSGISRGLIY